MADEIKVSASLELDTGTLAEELVLPTRHFDFSGTKFTKHTQSIGTSEEAIDLGEITTLGWVLAVNRDPTNFVSLKTATSGTVFAKLLPENGCALFHFGSGVTAPFAIADTAACIVEFFHVAGG